MKYRNQLSVAFIAVLSAGCTTPFLDYEGTAQRTALANMCMKEGYLSFQQFSYYSSFQFGSYAHQWEVDDVKLRQMYQNEVNRMNGFDWSNSRDMMLLECGNIATVADRVSPTNRAAAPASIPPSVPPPMQSTFCTNTGDITLCQTR